MNDRRNHERRSVEFNFNFDDIFRNYLYFTEIDMTNEINMLKIYEILLLFLKTKRNTTKYMRKKIEAVKTAKELKLII